MLTTSLLTRIEVAVVPAYHSSDVIAKNAAALDGMRKKAGFFWQLPRIQEQLGAHALKQIFLATDVWLMRQSALQSR